MFFRHFLKPIDYRTIHNAEINVIDSWQNHVLAGSNVRRHYLHHDYPEEKREAWKPLGSRVDAILAGANIFPLRNSRRRSSPP